MTDLPDQLGQIAGPIGYLLGLALAAVSGLYVFERNKAAKLQDKLDQQYETRIADARAHATELFQTIQAIRNIGGM